MQIWFFYSAEYHDPSVQTIRHIPGGTQIQNGRTITAWQSGTITFDGTPTRNEIFLKVYGEIIKDAETAGFAQSMIRILAYDAQPNVISDAPGKMIVGSVA